MQTMEWRIREMIARATHIARRAKTVHATLDLMRWRVLIVSLGGAVKSFSCLHLAFCHWSIIQIAHTPNRSPRLCVKIISGTTFPLSAGVQKPNSFFSC